MRSASKYLLIALAHAAVSTSGAAPVLAQSAYDPYGTTATDRDFAFAVRWGLRDNQPADDNPKGQHGSYCPPDH